eukprot:2634305-Rhodomonas_salina.2
MQPENLSMVVMLTVKSVTVGRSDDGLNETRTPASRTPSRTVTVTPPARWQPAAGAATSRDDRDRHTRTRPSRDRDRDRGSSSSTIITFDGGQIANRQVS